MSIANLHETNGRSAEIDEIQALKREPWFRELEKRIWEIWRVGEGDLTIEIRNSPKDSSGRRCKTVKMGSGTVFRYSEK
jgi:hypothetical protein